MSTLRQALIRLAHEQKELRPHILPLLTARTTGLPPGVSKAALTRATKVGMEKATAAQTQMVLAIQSLRDAVQVYSDLDKQFQPYREHRLIMSLASDMSHIVKYMTRDVDALENMVSDPAARAKWRTEDFQKMVKRHLKA